MNPAFHAQTIKTGRRRSSIELSKSTDPAYPWSAAAEAAHNRAQFVQEELSMSWPSLVDIKKSARSEWTIPSVKARIAELKSEHRQQLIKAIRFQLYEDHQAYREQYQTFDELEGWSAGSLEMMKEFHRMERRMRMLQSESFISQLRYMHIMALKPLYERLHLLMLTEENARLQRARRFPKSSQAWREMDTRDAKLKVAKFLLMDKREQEEVLRREPVWRADKADIDRVVLEFRSNVMFSTEVRNFVKASQTTDPRRRWA